MARYTTHLDYEGFGVYEFSGAPALGGDGGMGQLPSLPGGASLEQFVTVEGGIQIVKSENRKMAIGLLDNGNLDIDQEDPNAPRITGQAAAILGTIGSGWASDYLAKGYAVLVDKVSADSGSPQIMLTTVPEDIAGAAMVGGGYVVVDSPPGLLAAAQGLLKGIDPPPPPPPPPTCPSGSIFDQAAQRCVSKPKKSAIAQYALPGAILAAITLLYLATREKKKSQPRYVMNKSWSKARRRRAIKRMTKKGKKQLTKAQKRSRAAKKGWHARRRRERQEEEE